MLLRGGNAVTVRMKQAANDGLRNKRSIVWLQTLLGVWRAVWTGKVIAVCACTGREGSRRLGFPDFMTIGT